MNTAFTIILIFLSIILVALVLFQKSKGGGLASGFASGNQVLGAPKTTEFLEKATWTIVALIVALSILAVGLNKRETSKTKDNAQTQAIQAAEDIDKTATELPLMPEQPADNAE